MAQVVIRKLEDEVKAALKRRAKRHGRSMEDEVRHILRDAAKSGPEAARKLGSRVAGRFARVGLSGDLPEVHDQRITPATFDP